MGADRTGNITSGTTPVIIRADKGGIIRHSFGNDYPDGRQVADVTIGQGIGDDPTRVVGGRARLLFDLQNRPFEIQSCSNCVGSGDVEIIADDNSVSDYLGDSLRLDLGGCLYQREFRSEVLDALRGY